MRVIVQFSLFLLSFSLLAQQKYVSSGIIAYTGGAYERAIRDFSTALSDPALLQEEQAKAFFYRGLAQLKLAQGGEESGLYLKADTDFKKAIGLNAELWASRLEGVQVPMASGLLAAGKNLYHSAQSASASAAQQFYTVALSNLRAANSYQDTYEVNFHLGKTYLALADWYAASGSDRAVANYRAATNFLENALELKSNSTECISLLKNIASKTVGAVGQQRHETASPLTQGR